ncbi:DUF1735 and LamG domain-containing protein [Alistipes sp.]|uniref:DUF1735 and LamG domain-containing protein n=1 Tax=Alistipes sp. TaxID=1872444 RepID=UPI003AEF5CD1
MKLNKYLLVSFALAAAALTGCKKDDLDEHHFGNKLYISSALYTDDLLIDPANTELSRTVTMRMAQPASEDVTVRFEARPDLAAQYNQIYRDNAFALPKANYSLPETTATITAGNVSGDDIPVVFTGINELDVKMRYVLPVTISEVQGASVLESRRTVYFVVRGAALINVVADITKLKAPIGWSMAARSYVTGMRQITVEVLMRSKDWTGGRSGFGLSTIFGIESNFLLRIGDNGLNPNQLQLVSPSGNWPSKSQSPALPVDEWVHIAVVYDAINREMHYYFNGELAVSQTNSSSQSVSLLQNCYIGYAYDDTRWFPGEMSEMRIWNVVRTQQQIKDNPYRVDPATPGLVAYWKFNEGQGSKIMDHSGNGTDLNFRRNTGQTESDDITWVPVEIPALK